MTEDEDTTIWQKVKRKSAHPTRGPDRRAPEPANYLAWLPLALAILAGVAGYVRTQSNVEVLRRDVDQVVDWNIKLGERLRTHKDTQH